MSDHWKGRNLIKNGCGHENFSHWEILSKGGDGWTIEKPPGGVKDFPKKMKDYIKIENCCFVTSYGKCLKEQVINLAAAGVSPEVMDHHQPKIKVSEWYSGRFDCESTYLLEVKLLNHDKTLAHDSSGQPLSIKISKEVGSEDDCEWHKFKHVFKKYVPGIRYVVFQHGGQDKKYWKGHFGSKMTGASIVLKDD